MYVNWQVSGNNTLLVVLTGPTKAGYSTRVLKFNPSASAIVALLDAGHEHDELFDRLTEYGFMIDKAAKDRALSFAQSAKDLIASLSSSSSRVKESFARFGKQNGSGRNMVPKILFDSTFPGMMNDSWHRYLGRYASHEQFFYPIKVNFDVTSECNLQCVFCYLKPEDKNKRALPLEEVKRAIDRIQEANVRIVNLFGGEPLLRKDIFEIIDYIQHKGMLVTINTNGTLLGRETLAKLKKLGIHSLHISLDGDNERTYARVRGSGVFGAVVENIRNAVTAGLPVQVNVVLSRLNFFRLPFIYLLLNRIGAPAVSVGSFHAIGSGKENSELLAMSRAAYFLWVRICRVLAFFGTTDFCIKKRCDANSYVHIDAAGDFHFCSQMPRSMPLGNIFSQGLLEGWHSESYRGLFDISRLSEPCRSCKFKDIICNHWRCRAEASAQKNDFFDSMKDCLLGKISRFIPPY